MADTRTDLVAFSPESDDELLAFELQKFFPHIVSIFYRDVVSAIASVYQPTYGMTSGEWLILLVLGSENKLTAQEIVRRSAMDKAAVSRALERMKHRVWIDIAANASDGRSKLISLSDEGKSIYFELTPRALRLEHSMLNSLTEDEEELLIRTMQEISVKIRML